MQSTFAKRQFEFVVFVGYIVLLYFLLWSTLSVTKYIFFILSIDWMLEFFALSWCRWNWSHDKEYILGLADLFWHNKYLNLNCKPVSGFQTLIKSAVAYIKFLRIKRVVSISPASTKMLRTHMTTTRTAGIPPGPGSSYEWYQFLFFTGFYLLFSKVSKLLWSDVWFRFNKC